MSSIHMSQSQSMSMQGGMGMGGMHAQGPGSGMQQQSCAGAGGRGDPTFPSLHSSSFSGQPADFNLDFLDNMPSSDASNLTAQELLNSLENSFLNDIL